MNDKRSAVAVLVCLMFIMFYNQMYVQPMFEPHKRAQLEQSGEGTAPGSKTTAEGTTGVANQSNPSQSPTVATKVTTKGSTQPTLKELAESPRTRVSTDLIDFTFVHLGGRLESVKLKRYKRSRGSKEILDLLGDNVGQTILPGGIHRDSETDGKTLYQLEKVSGAKGDDGQFAAIEPVVKLVFTGTLPGGDSVKKIIEIPRSSYLVKLQARLDGTEIPGAPLTIDWSHYLPKSELENRLDPREFQYVAEGNNYSSVPVANLDPGEMKQEPQGKWIAFGGKYFMEALVNSEGHVISFGRDQDRFYSSMEGELSSVDASLYLGPKDRDILADVGFELWKAVDLGWFTVVAEPLLWLLKLLYSLLGNYGLAIIGLTLLVKLALFPLASKSYSSMAKMQEIQPEVKRIQDKYQDDQQKLQQELMGLYKRKGVNPLGGCLPMLFQIPVFLGLYNGLLKSIELRHAPYALWINDLSAPEGLMLFGIPVPVMILLMGASMIIQQWVTPSAADPQQKKMMMMMPVIFTGMFIFFPMPSGLVLYWLTNNIISIIQQRYLKNHADASPLLATVLASGGIFAVGFILTLL